MDIESIREYVLAKPAVTEGFPFGESVLVFKINEKIFLLLSLDAYPLQFNVKADPDKAIELRDAYPTAILPGYHMNKKHWNTIVLNGQLPGRLILEMIDESYKLVAKLKR
ncbi:MAG: MmcQ/YjbR family DNA-binding protein [Chitinophagaceae bacterium]